MKNRLIRNHLRNMIILGIPMQAMCGGVLYPNCRLRILDGEIFGLAGVNGTIEPGSTSLSYTLDGYIYGFETDVTTKDEEAGAYDALPIRLPKKIARIERRKSYRVTCFQDEPVAVSLLLESGEVKAEAIAVSEESIGLSLPADTLEVKLDSIVALRIDLPRLGDVSAGGSIRFIRDSSGNQGLVVRLNEMSDADRDRLRRYIRGRRVETREGTEPGTRESGFVIAKYLGGRKYLFWCPAHLLGNIDVMDEALDVVSVDTLEFL